jgi:FkbM family methyltransferase
MLPERVKHWGRLGVDPDYRWRHRELQRLRRLPRYTRAATPLLGRFFEMADAESFLSMYRDLFEREIYRFKCANEEPFIIDGGANIGLSVLYFKRLYPRSRIIAFEPDPEIFSLLERNCATFELRGVELVNRALWTSESTLKFVQEGGDSGRLQKHGEAGRIIQVPTVRLKDYLRSDIEFLKLDIEGAETEVLRDCANELCKVGRLFVEYHSFVDSPQTLHEITAIINRAGFRLHMHSSLPSPQPFVERSINFGLDFQANIFAYRS